MKLSTHGMALAESSGTTITGLPALLIILAILAAIVGVGIAIGRLSKRPKK